MGNEIKSGCLLIIGTIGHFFSFVGTLYVFFIIFNPESLFGKIVVFNVSMFTGFIVNHVFSMIWNEIESNILD
jgi:hypothetical protein